MSHGDSKYKIITGDFNLKKKKEEEEDFKNMGAFGTGEKSERRDHLIRFAEEHKLIIANTVSETIKIDTGLGSHPMKKQEPK